MSEKEKQKEVFLDHSSHQHPFILTSEPADRRRYCWGCLRYIFSGETVYRCIHRCKYYTLHEECAEMPREITLSSHLQHSLIQKQLSKYPSKCAVCKVRVQVIGYYCSSPYPCDFQIHLGCVHSMDVTGEPSRTKHPSHPQHDLKLLWRPGRAASIRCDACGGIHSGNSYVCTVCSYSINESCAALAVTVDGPHLHGHPLSLAYRLPREYSKICRYVVHLNCAATASPLIKDVDPSVIAVPVHDVAEELIGPFVTKLGVKIMLSSDNEIVNGEYKFHSSDHRLRLISPPLHNPEESCHDDNDDEEDDADLNYSKFVCDACTAPISSSYKYISCSDCNYFLHLACFQLPPEIPSHPLHPNPHHILTLHTRPKLNFVYCNICGFYTNGLFYSCNKCIFKVDIKCVSLPDTIKHAAHPHHRPNLLTTVVTSQRDFYFVRMCNECGSDAFGHVCYTCDVCQIILHSKCAVLPAQVSNPRWDKHPLPLTFHATANHPSDFYCEVCEKQMHPKMWMYHCRDCDVSIHPKCLPTSGAYRNIKFGHRYDIGTLHQHPIVHQLTNKLRCDVCGKRNVHGTRGFQCGSHKCDFFMCFHSCGAKHRNVIHAID
ncbi:hypothetical protein AAHA92_30383 [Salvia divinorum]|uniref:Zinc finger PHD-type domain-containing protein n=1 Tax=Salvia divinorum TaxID=28513 RepID=A0ABD1FQP0_SALDI